MPGERVSTIIDNSRVEKKLGKKKTIEIDGLSEQKITTFASLFGDYGCVEFEEGVAVQNAIEYDPE